MKIIKTRAYHADCPKDDGYIRELNGKDVSRYYYKWPGKQWISYGSWLAHPRKPHFFKGERILVREITNKGIHSILMNREKLPSLSLSERLEQYDKLADIVRHSLNLELVYQICGLEIV